ncbi:MAG: hypothetical protein WKF35_01310 [Ferruginibacter sp.]
MLTNTDQVNDWSTLKLLSVNNISAWESLYSRYSGLMYGCILKLTADPSLSEFLFKQIFLSLKTVSLPEKNLIPFAFWLWQHTSSAATRLINADNNKSQKRDNDSILYDLCIKKDSVKVVAKAFQITEHELRKQVHSELSGRIAV